MRHQKAGLKLNRTSSHRSAMFRNMVTSLFKHERIRTTNAKAKELRRWAEHLITLGKRGDLHARRQALAIIREKAVVHKLFDEVAKRYGKIAGGYTRVTKVGRRVGDAAPLSIVELIVPEKAVKKKKKAAPKKTKPKTVQKARPAAEGAKTEKDADTVTADAAEAGPAVEPAEKAPGKKKAKSVKAEPTPAPSDEPAADAAAAAPDEKPAAQDTTDSSTDDTAAAASTVGSEETPGKTPKKKAPKKKADADPDAADQAPQDTGDDEEGKDA